jgi:hypothetical protein
LVPHQFSGRLVLLYQRTEERIDQRTEKELIDKRTEEELNDQRTDEKLKFFSSLIN